MIEPRRGSHEGAPSAAQVADRIRAVLGPGVRPAPKAPVPSSQMVAARIQQVLAKAPRPLASAPNVLRSRLGAPSDPAARAANLAALALVRRGPIPSWAAPAFPELAQTEPSAPPTPGASSSGAPMPAGPAPAAPLLARAISPLRVRLGEAGRPSRAAARQAKTTPAGKGVVVWRQVSRRRWWVSLAFHSVVLTSLGFFELAQHTDLGQRLFDPANAAPPVHRVTLRESAPPRIDLDRAARTPRAIDLWNTPYEGPGGDDRKGLEIGDHEESADGEDYGKLKGGLFSLEGPLGSHRGWGGTAKGADGVRAGSMGVGQGGGRPRPGLAGSGQGDGVRRGGEAGGRRNLVLRGGGSDATEHAVGAGLRWLARHQNPDGSWDAEGYHERCCGDQPCDARTGSRLYHGKSIVGLTGLVAMAFLDAGYEPSSHARYEDEISRKPVSPGRVVARALRWLCDHQEDDGGWRMQGAEIYDEAIATMALAEACARTNAVLYRAAARRAVSFLESSRNPTKGWRYGPRDGDNDASATGWCVLALRAAQSATLDVDPDGLRSARDYCVSITDASGWTHYQTLGGAREHHRVGNVPSSLLCRLFVDHRLEDDDADKAMKILGENRPSWSTANPHNSRGSGSVGTNFYAWYYGTLALYTVDGPDGNEWRRWNDALTKALLGGQVVSSRSCEAGSWPFAQDFWGSVGGGRVFATAINCLSLEVYYRYAPLFTLDRR